MLTYKTLENAKALDCVRACEVWVCVMCVQARMYVVCACAHVACVARPLKQQFRWRKPPVQAQNRLVSSQGFGRCWSSEPGSLSLPWRGSSFQINTVRKADRFLTWTLVWVPTYYKKPVKKMIWELRTWFQNIICAQNTSAGVNRRMVETSWVSWVSNLWKYHIMSFF